MRGSSGKGPFPKHAPARQDRPLPHDLPSHSESRQSAKPSQSSSPPPEQFVSMSALGTQPGALPERPVPEVPEVPNEPAVPAVPEPPSGWPVPDEPPVPPAAPGDAPDGELSEPQPPRPTAANEVPRTAT